MKIGILSNLVPLAGLTALGLLALGGSLGGEFVWDDRPLIVENSRVRDPAQMGEILTSSFWETGDRHDRFRAFFRPAVGLSFAADHAVWGLRPFGFRLTNLVLHLLCCGLIYRLAMAEGFNRWAALAGAALFAVHPVHVESVAWISGRTDLLAAAFMLASFLVWRRAEPGDGRLVRRAAACGLFALALLAKEMAATLPVLVFLDRWLRPAERRRGRLVESLGAALPFLGILALYFGFRVAVLGAAGEPLYRLAPVEWLATALFALARYATLMILPRGLDAHYPYEPQLSLLAPLVAWSVLMLGVIFAAGRQLVRTSPRGGFWIAWIPVTLLPVLSFGRFGDVVMADRFLYIPSAGLALLASLGLSRLADPALGKAWRRAVAVASVAIIGLLGAASAQRTAVWRDDLALFTDMLRTSPGSPLVRSNFGLALFDRGRLDEAMGEYRTAIDLAPGYAMAHNNLAAALERTGRLEEALGHYRTAIAQAPGLTEARVNAGHLLVRVGRASEGLVLLREMVRLHPRSAPARFALAHALHLQGDVAQAERQVVLALRADPAHASARYLLGKIRFEQGRFAEAVREMRAFLDLWPDDDDHAAAARRIIERARREAAGTKGPVESTRL